MTGLFSAPSCPGPVKRYADAPLFTTSHDACGIAFAGTVIVVTPDTDRSVANALVKVPIPVTFKFAELVVLVTVKLFPIVQDVLIATVFALRFRLLGLVTVGVPEAFSKFNSFTPKLLSAIILFNYL